MDNEAFRALVEERAKPKSSKEIAREAVEEEFRARKSKRKRGGGGSSSEEEDSDNDSDREEVPNKQDLLIPTAAAKKKARTEHEAKYRDRAKERREGKNIDYQHQASLLEGVAAAADEGQMDQVTMSKYLGGDEAHTHLVKGLDVALARRVKRELDNKGETNQTKIEKTSVPATKHVEKKSTVVVRDTDEARALLQNTNPETISSELGRQMLSHMKNMHLPSRDLSKVAVRESPAGLAIQRSSLTFSALGDPRDRNRAWERPLESMQASIRRKAEPETSLNGTTSLDDTLLHQIKLAFERHQGTKINSNQKRVTNGGREKSPRPPENGNDDDDDIFDDVDDDYVPPSKTVSKRDGREDSQSRVKDIFDGLTAPKPSQSTPIESTRSGTQEPAVDLEKHKVISRDVFGSMPQASKTSPKLGVSIASYDGGYGEEMDVDFDGRFAAEEAEGEKKSSSS